MFSRLAKSVVPLWPASARSALALALLAFGSLMVTPSAEAQFLFVSGGQTQLRVRPPLLAGLDLRPDEDASTRLLWLFGPRRVSKIVVSTVAPGQSFRLFTEPRSVLQGTAMPEMQLIDGAPSQDFIRNIPRRTFIGAARVYFRAEAPAALGNSQLNGNDNHTVYFTWTAQ